ncbi:MAG: alanine racemase [Lachnospiraceae bacterium]|nr:alanine racemase [Lachnospiraceae bacterium]
MERSECFVDLSVIEDNLKKLHELSKGQKMLAVIKANGYGHGSVKIAKKVEGLDFLEGFAVATAEEAFELRNAGIKKTILILGFTFEKDFKELIKKEISLTVFNTDVAKDLSVVAGLVGKTAKIHIKLDTGMGRIGFYTGSDGAGYLKSIKDIEFISKLPNVELEGIFSHMAKADELDKSSAIEQIKKYSAMIKSLEDIGITPKFKHLSNSAGIIDLPHAHFDLVRAGIALYGLYPSPDVDIVKAGLKPALSWHSSIVHIKTVEKGSQISYGGTFIAGKETVIATVPIGYADGYPRSLSNKGYVLIRGKKAPITGRVCMDQMMVDVTDIPEAELFDRVTLVGTDGERTITLEELGDMSGRFNYELACDISLRVPRKYVGE